MKTFEWPSMKIVTFLTEDILTASGIDAGGGENVGGSTEIKEPVVGGITVGPGMPLN